MAGKNVDQKLDLLVQKLKRYDVCVVGIQETKLFAKDVWLAIDGCMFLHLGHPLPEGMLLHTEMKVLEFVLIVRLLRQAG